MNERNILVVAEETHYNDEPITDSEEFGRTIYVEEAAVIKTVALYKEDGELVSSLDKFPFVIGKKKENVDLVINDYSASRIHARITHEESGYYIEDLNSTNGTFKNGLRLQPYEKRKLESGDELRFGKTEYVYR
jgi:pSer/pThr/pTyr-binding forkhead associated (FHA) protein